MNMALTFRAALFVSSPTKRKADVYEDADSENIDPDIFSPKRTKASDTYVKPSPTHLVLAKVPTTKTLSTPSKPLKSTNTSRPILQARSPASRINTTVIEKPLSAPAGRSPTRKRAGILNRRRTSAEGTPYTRVDPPKFSIGAASDNAAPFSIAAALSGTIPSYSARAQVSEPSAQSTPVPQCELDLASKKDSWFFEIHEDTEEETLHNLMYHSTTTLDISSDEETEARRRDERGKENVPPVDDVSQSHARLPRDLAKSRSFRKSKLLDENAIDIDRSPLGDLEAEEFYPDGCGAGDLIVIVDDVDAEAEPEAETEEKDARPSFEFTVDAQVKGKGRAIDEAVELLMARSNPEAAKPAALFSPIEKAEEGFEIWESGSAKGESEI